MIKINKKSNTTYILAMVVLTLISFVLYLSFFTNLMPNAVSSTDDIVCRTYLSMKSFPGVKIGELFYNINQKCRVDDDIKIDLNDKEEAFEEVAVEMSRCWYRYGEGELDFLSNWDTSGNWCFLCGSVKMEDNPESLNFEDFVKWSQENKFNESLSYYEYIGIKHTDIKDVELEELREDYQNLINDPDLAGEYKDLLMVLSNQISDLTELKNKRIDSTDEKIYVVYRYDRVDKSFEEEMSDAGNSALVGALGSVAVSMLAEGLAEAAIGSAGGALMGSIVPTGVTTVVGGVVGGIGGFLYGSVKALVKTANAVDEVFRITKIMKKVSKFVQNSKFLVKHGDELLEYSDELLEVEQVAVGLTKTEVKLSKRIQDFEASPNDMNGFAKIISKDNPDMGEAFEGISEFMTDLGIKDFKSIDPKIIELRADKVKLINDLEKNINNIKPDDLEKLAIKEGKLIEEIQNLEALRDLALEEISKMKSTVSINEIPGIKNYLRAASVIVPAVAGAYVGSSLNDNYRQYVDLLTREQYYRLCGTERGNFG